MNSSPGVSRRDRPQGVVEDVRTDVVDGAADRDGGVLAGLPVGARLVDRRGDGALGGAVDVEPADVLADPFLPGQQGLAGRLLAGHDHRAQRGLRGQPQQAVLLRDPAVPESRGHAQEGRTGVDDLLGQGPERLAQGVAAEDQGRAVQERREDLLGGGVEAQRPALQDAVAGGEREVPVHGGAVVRQRAVRHQDALGAARGAGGVDDVGGVRRQREGAVRRGRGGQGVDVLPVLVEADDLAVVVREERPQRLLGQEQACARVGQDVPQPLDGVLGVEGHVGGAGPQDAEQGCDHLRRPLDAQAHERAGPDAAQPQIRGQLAGIVVELTVRQWLVPPDQGRRLGGAHGLGGEQVVQAGARVLPVVRESGGPDVRPVGADVLQALPAARRPVRDAPARWYVEASGPQSVPVLAVHQDQRDTLSS